MRNINEEATSLGAAVLAAYGAGLFPDISKAAENICKIDKRWSPNENHYEFYDKIFRFSNRLYSNLSDNDFYKNFNDIFQN